MTTTMTMNPTICVAFMMISFAVCPAEETVTISDTIKIEEIRATLEGLAGKVDKTEPQIQNLYDKKVHESRKWDLTDKRGLPIWSVILTKATRGLNGQSDKYKAAFRKLMSVRIDRAGEIPTEGSLQESIAQYAKIVLGVRDDHLTMKPTKESYHLFKDAMRNLRSVASQRVLEQEVNENEVVLKKAGNTAGAIRTWSYVNLIVVAAVLLILVLGFTLWFCWVARAKRIEDAAQRARAEARAERDTEMRIAGHVASEVIPLVPTAPPHPRGRPFTSRT